MNPDEPEYDAAVAVLKSTLGPDDFSAAWAAGAALSLDEAVAYVRRTRGTRRRPTSRWARLTPTELDVPGWSPRGSATPRSVPGCSSAEEL
jgi:hypothetical protein